MIVCMFSTCKSGEKCNFIFCIKLDIERILKSDSVLEPVHNPALTNDKVTQ